MPSTISNSLLNPDELKLVEEIEADLAALDKAEEDIKNEETEDFYYECKDTVTENSIPDIRFLVALVRRFLEAQGDAANQG